MMWWTQGGDVSGWWMLGGWLWMVVFWGGLAALVVWGIRAATRSRGGEGEHRPSALDIAKERYARGEISREQYEELRRTLQV